MRLVALALKSENGSDFKYCIPDSLGAKLHRVALTAGGSTASIAGSVASGSAQQKYLVSSLIMEEAISSAQLEGASTTRKVAKKMLEESREPKDEHERMILNNYMLILEAEHVSKEALTLDMLLDFHRLATNGTSENDVVPGEFRANDEIWIGDEQEEVAHKPPPFSLIRERMQNLCDFANTDHSGENGFAFITPVVKGIILHFMIGYEHPFDDGNGRTARALFYWYMLKHGYNLFKYVSISKLLKAEPKQYGLAFLYTETDDYDLTYFIDYQLDIVIKAFDELQDYLWRKTKEFEDVMELLKSSKYNECLNYHQKDLIKKGTKDPGRVFTVKEVSSDYECSENSARKYLNELVDLKLFMLTSSGRQKLYVAPSGLRERLQ
jgi:Fic family protein